MTEITDCLVMRIREHDNRITDLESDVDIDMFIFYDSNCMGSNFMIRGNRGGNSKNYQDYSFSCYDYRGVKNFIEVVTGNASSEFTNTATTLTIDLLNYKDFPFESDLITYDYLVKNFKKRNIIVGYDYVAYDKSLIDKMLKMMSSVYNEYHKKI